MRELCAGRIAAVTGATSGIGEAVARCLAREGAAGLTLSGRDVDRGAALAEELAALGCETQFVRANLENPSECTEIVARTVGRWGQVDCLANCGGSTARAALDDISPEFFDWMMAVNVRAPMLTMQTAIRDMRRRGEPGTIVNIVSMSAYGGQPYLTAYSASKGALLTLTRNVAYAHRRDRIRVNGINLGWADTPWERQTQLRGHGHDATWFDAISAEQPMGRLAQPAELAELVVLLLSGKGGIMTGAIIDYTQEPIGGWD